MGAGGCGVQKREHGNQERQYSYGTQHPELDPNAVIVYALVIVPFCHFSTTLHVGQPNGEPTPRRLVLHRQTAH